MQHVALIYIICTVTEVMWSIVIIIFQYQLLLQVYLASYPKVSFVSSAASERDLSVRIRWRRVVRPRGPRALVRMELKRTGRAQSRADPRCWKMTYKLQYLWITRHEMKTTNILDGKAKWVSLTVGQRIKNGKKQQWIGGNDFLKEYKLIIRSL